MGRKITDLEKFVQTDIYSPYKNELDIAYERLSAPIPRDLANAKYHLMNVPEWRELVLDRIRRINYTFPNYIQHELVSYIKSKEWGRKNDERG